MHECVQSFIKNILWILLISSESFPVAVGIWPACNNFDIFAYDIWFFYQILVLIWLFVHLDVIYDLFIRRCCFVTFWWLLSFVSHDNFFPAIQLDVAFISLLFGMMFSYPCYSCVLLSVIFWFMHFNPWHLTVYYMSTNRFYDLCSMLLDFALMSLSSSINFIKKHRTYRFMIFLW